MTNMLDEPDPIRLQAGWQVFSRDGIDLGEVLGAGQDRFLIRAEGHATRRFQLPTELIAQEEPAQMRAQIRIDAADVRPDHRSIVSIPGRNAQ